ncbi:hypothetical protein CUMW_217600 [Citrus unshiu]|uniref:Uncharacterized protein n=1 Tax=Citrus unshiu TaxID=55188 RepID=A0A2H5QDV8_CITUN|nr:hypothetical protein CUMW_217600 [Citrus unshiu]
MSYQGDKIQSTIGEPAHGRVVGWGVGIKGKDVYGSPSQGVKDLEKEVEKLKRLIKLVLGKSAQESSQKDIVLTEEDDDGYEDDEVDANDSETKEVALKDD